jgi:hypothetical protein
MQGYFRVIAVMCHRCQEELGQPQLSVRVVTSSCILKLFQGFVLVYSRAYSLLVELSPDEHGSGVSLCINLV